MSDYGGDPPCLLGKVCDRCGSVIEGSERHRCRDSTSDVAVEVTDDDHAVQQNQHEHTDRPACNDAGFGRGSPTVNQAGQDVVDGADRCAA
jgi:hypothetical protein